MNSGIYQITNTLNNKSYVGSSAVITRRWNEHRCALRKGTHKNAKLQASWRKHGEEHFVFSVITHCGHSELIAFEQQYIDKLKPQYNLAPVAGNNLGVRLDENAKIKMKAAWTDERKLKHLALHKGKKVSTESRFKITEKWTIERRALLIERNKKPWTNENRLAASRSHKGVVRSEESKQKQSMNSGKSWTPERRAAQAERMAVKNKEPWSSERRTALSVRNKGNKWHLKTQIGALNTP